MLIIRNILNHRRILAAGAMFFMTLSCWSLASPILSAPDSANHIAHIWCSSTFHASNCSDNDPTVEDINLTVPANFCYPDTVFLPANCTSANVVSVAISTQNYPSLFFRVMNVFVTNNMSLSVVLMRLFNSLIFVVLFVSQIILGSKKLVLAFLTAFLFTITPYLLFLIPSINPSSWAIIGLSNSAFFLLSIFHNNVHRGSRRHAIWFFWFISILLCLARYDSTVICIATNLIVVLSVQHKFFLQIIRKYAFVLMFGFFVVGILTYHQISLFLNWLSDVMTVNTIPFNPLGPNFGTWLSSWLMHFWAIPMESFGTGGLGWREIPIPQFVSLSGIGLLSAVLIMATVKINRRQLTVSGLCLTIMLFNILAIANRELDMFNVTARHIIPIFPFIIGSWIYFSNSPIQFLEIRNLRNMAITLIAISNFIALYTTIERYTVGWSGGVRLIRLRSFEHWWWNSLPVGPNFIVFMGTVTYLMFLVAVTCMVPLQDLEKVPVNNIGYL